MRQAITTASHPQVIEALKRIFPTYRGRKFYIAVRRQYRVWDFWDGGSRTYTTFVDMTTGRTVGSDALPDHLRQKQGNWFNLPISDYFDLPPDIAVAERSIFCGKEAGLTLVISEQRQQAFDYVNAKALST